MSILSGRQLGKFFGAQDVFTDLSFDMAHGDKVGLVGPNGVGKTTLVRLILGFEEPDHGHVHRARGLRIGYLPQHAELVSDQTLYGEMLSVFERLRQQERAILALAEELAADPQNADVLQRYARAEELFELAGGYAYENDIRRVLSGLGFGPETYDWPIAVLSGGQITRALLAKLLLEQPEILVLDEPTNYLDLAAMEWLESYLRDWPHSLLVVSHDRYFLDQVVNRIWEMTSRESSQRGALVPYRGNYTHYLAQRADRLMRQQREYEQQQATVAKTEEFIRRYKAGQRSKEARGRQTRLARLELLAAPTQAQRIRLQLGARLRSGDNVLMSDGVTIGYETRPERAPAAAAPQRFPLVTTGEFLIQRGQRIALLGPNGSGKTTFLRTILGELAPLAGHIRVGANVQFGYLPQKQDWLTADKSVLDHILDASALEVGPARDLLARFLFTGDDVFKPVGALSGGERSRLALAILTLHGANFLLLDEPTTHLDVEAQEVLQSVLDDFTGTILYVTHDRYLMNALSTHVWAIVDGRLSQYEGTYADYLAALEAERLQEPIDADACNKREPERPNDRRERDAARDARARGARARGARARAARVAALEAEIAAYEQQLAQLTDLLDRASADLDTERLHTLGLEYQRAQQALDASMQVWEQCHSEEESD